MYNLHIFYICKRCQVRHDNCLVSKQASLLTCIVTKQTSSLVFHPLKIIAPTYIIHLCRENTLFSVSFPSYCLIPRFKYVCLFVSRGVLPDRHVRICRDPQGRDPLLWPPLRGAYIKGQDCNPNKGSKTVFFFIDPASGHFSRQAMLGG